MSWLTSIFSGGVDKVVDSVASGLDNLFTSDEEKLLLKNKLQEAMNNYNLEIEKQVIAREQEITSRWKSDNDHQLTRLVRPALVVYSVVIFTIIAILDGNVGEFTVNVAYIPVFQMLLMTTVGGYFALRTFDKYTINKGK